VDTRTIKTLVRLITVAMLCCSANAHAGIADVFRKQEPDVLVADPFLEMHTGPGRGYPVFYVAGSGESIKILKRRTDWFKVELRRGEHRIKRGWVPLAQMRGTLDASGEPVNFPGMSRGDFETRKWEMGFAAGDFDGARTVDAYLAYGLTKNISLRLTGTQILGSFSDGQMGTVNVVMYPFPEWRVSPYFTVGTGIIHTEPQTTIVAAEDRTDEIVNAGMGANIYLTRRFVLVCAAVLAAGLASERAHAAQASAIELEPLIVRENERREVNIDRLDNENFEIGGFAGMLSVEDFGSDVVYGVRGAYHITEDFFVEAAYASSTLGETSFERLSGGAQLLTDDERDFSYYNMGVGVNILPGEAFITDRWAFKGGLYLIAGVGSSEFGGDDRFTVNGGLGYRLAATDWLAFRIDVRDHIFKSDLLGENKTLHNFELTAGLTVFF